MLIGCIELQYLNIRSDILVFFSFSFFFQCLHSVIFQLAGTAPLLMTTCHYKLSTFKILYLLEIFLVFNSCVVSKTSVSQSLLSFLKFHELHVHSISHSLFDTTALKSFDRPIIRVSLTNSILVTHSFY